MMNEVISAIESWMSIQGIVTFAMGTGASALIFWAILRKGLKLWWRIGKGLASKKIAIFAISEYSPLKHLLVDFGMVSKKNITQISLSEIGKARGYSAYIVYYPEFQDKIEQIINQIEDGTLLVVYAPPEKGRIPVETMNIINRHRNAITVNFRGRLLTDVIFGMAVSKSK